MASLPCYDALALTCSKQKVHACTQRRAKMHKSLSTWCWVERCLSAGSTDRGQCGGGRSGHQCSARGAGPRPELGRAGAADQGGGGRRESGGRPGACAAPWQERRHTCASRLDHRRRPRRWPGRRWPGQRCWERWRGWGWRGWRPHCFGEFFAKMPCMCSACTGRQQYDKGRHVMQPLIIIFGKSALIADY